LIILDKKYIVDVLKIKDRFYNLQIKSFSPSFTITGLRTPSFDQIQRTGSVPPYAMKMSPNYPISYNIDHLFAISIHMSKNALFKAL